MRWLSPSSTTASSLWKPSRNHSRTRPVMAQHGGQSPCLAAERWPRSTREVARSIVRPRRHRRAGVVGLDIDASRFDGLSTYIFDFQCSFVLRLRQWLSRRVWSWRRQIPVELMNTSTSARARVVVAFIGDRLLLTSPVFFHRAGPSLCVTTCKISHSQVVHQALSIAGDPFGSILF